jgi:hypothetical protein
MKLFDHQTSPFVVALKGLSIPNLTGWRVLKWHLRFGINDSVFLFFSLFILNSALVPLKIQINPNNLIFLQI